MKMLFILNLFLLVISLRAEVKYFSTDVNFFNKKENHGKLQELEKNLKAYKILLVPGLATDLTQKAGEITGLLGLTNAKGFLAPFYAQMAWLRSVGLDISMVSVNRVGGCMENGEVIANAIATSSKPVVLITQSKGGVDALHGLLRFPHLQKKIKKWIAYQPPILGTPLANIVQENLTLNKPVDGLLALLKGTALTYEDMTTVYRTNYFTLFESEIKKLVESVPTTILVTLEKPANFASYLLEHPSKNAFLSPLVPVITNYNKEINDGIAMVKGTCLEKARCFFLDNVDHFAAVMDTAPYKGLSKEARVGLMQYLLYYSL